MLKRPQYDPLSIVIGVNYPLGMFGVILSFSVHNLGQLEISPSEDLVLGISEVITLDV